jgi:hypothetical protein
VATVGFLGERALSLGRMTMCLLDTIGLFSQASGNVWIPLTYIAMYPYLFHVFVIIIIIMAAAELNYFLELGKRNFRNL